jgi:hypothetical protein
MRRHGLPQPDSRSRRNETLHLLSPPSRARTDASQNPQAINDCRIATPFTPLYSRSDHRDPTVPEPIDKFLIVKTANLMITLKHEEVDGVIDLLHGCG